MSGERVLVTGAAGFIGSHFVERLLSLGAIVTGVDNFDPFYAPEEKRANLSRALEHPGFRLIEGDCAEPESLESSLDGEPIDAIVHLAAKAGVRPSLADPAGYLRANVVATQSILELARRRGIGRIVFGSSSSVYGNNARLPFSEDIGPTLRDRSQVNGIARSPLVFGAWLSRTAHSGHAAPASRTSGASGHPAGAG